MQTLWNFMYIDDAVEAVYELANNCPSLQMKGLSSGLVKYHCKHCEQDTRVLKDFVEEIHTIAGGAGELAYGFLSRQKKARFP